MFAIKDVKLEDKIRYCAQLYDVDSPVLIENLVDKALEHAEVNGLMDGREDEVEDDE